MRANWKIGLVLVLLVAGGGIWLRQRWAATTLREEIVLRGTDAEADRVRLQRENERLMREQPLPGEREKRLAEQAEMDRLRAEIENLKTKLAEKTAAPAEALVVTGPVVTPPAQSLMTPASAWKNAGRATPRATLETALWAAAGGDVEALGALIELEPKTREQAAALLVGLPLESQARYGTPERIVALLTAQDATFDGMRILTERKRGDREATLNVVFASGTTTRGAHLTLRRSDDGWRLVVPESAIEKFAAMLKGQPAPAKR